MGQQARIKRAIYWLAVAIVLIAAGLRFAGVDRALVGILAGAGGLLVVLLLITYRAFSGVVSAAGEAAAAEAEQKRTARHDLIRREREE